jgi:cytochrome c oxidase assembly factor CtaG
VPVVIYLPLALCWAALALHLAGERRAVVLTGRPRDRRARWRAGSFYAGLLTIFIALGSPIESLSQKLFWVHMTQHVLLITVAAPLIVLGAPWMSIWRPLPLGFRRSVARTVSRSPSFAPLRALAGWLSRPLGAWLAFAITLVAWHVPAAYDLTLRSNLAHALEHTTFMVFAILLWAQVLSSPPLKLRLSPVRRVYYITGATVVGWLLSIVLALAPTPLYPAYAHLSHRPTGISALADQQLAAGVMLGPGSLSMTLFVFAGLYRWLGEDESPRRGGGHRSRAPGTGPAT